MTKQPDQTILVAGVSRNPASPPGYDARALCEPEWLNAMLLSGTTG